MPPTQPSHATVHFRATLAEVAAAAEGRLEGDPGKLVIGVTTDSREVPRGSLFVALVGPRFDGHDFVAQAAERGAVAALLESGRSVAPHQSDLATILVADTLIALGRLARWHRDRFQLPVVAITGSSGKSTTKDLAAAVLATRWQVHKTTASLNNRIGVPLTLFALGPEHGAAVIEAGISMPGEMMHLASIIAPTVRVVLNAGQAHIEFLKDAAGVAREKAILYDDARPDDVLIYNSDDRLVSAEALRRPVGRRLSFGLSKTADVRAVELHSCGADGSRFRLLTNLGEVDVRLRLPGDHNVMNALAASAIGLATGLSLTEIAAGIDSHAVPPVGRSQIFRLPGSITLIDDSYNSNPESADAALRMLVSLRGESGLAIAVFADMLELGDAGLDAHKKLGQQAARLSVDRLITHGPLSLRTAEAATLGNSAMDVRHCADLAEVVDALIGVLRTGDVVLVKGSRGMRMEKVAEAIRARLTPLDSGTNRR